MRESASALIGNGVEKLTYKQISLINLNCYRILPKPKFNYFPDTFTCLFYSSLLSNPHSFKSKKGAEYFKTINIIITHADWLTEWGMLRACASRKCRHVHTLFTAQRERERGRESECNTHNNYN